jgi:hypothetical protein
MSKVCQCCGEIHDGLPRDIDFGKPGAYLALSPRQQKSRCHLTPDICTIGKKRFFIHGSLPVPVRDAGGVFAWGLWAEVSPHVFAHYQQVVDNADVQPLPSFGSLSVEHLPPFRGMDRLPVMMRFGARGQRPILTLEPSNHWLCRHQQNGITLHHLQEILHSLFPQHF